MVSQTISSSKYQLFREECQDQILDLIAFRLFRISIYYYPYPFIRSSNYTLSFGINLYIVTYQLRVYSGLSNN